MPHGRPTRRGQVPRRKDLPLGAAGFVRHQHASRLALAGTLLVTFAVYARTLGNGFIDFDDPESVTGNPWIRELDWASLRHFFTTPLQLMYTPLASVSFALDYQIGELDPAMYHLTNLVLHLCNVVLVFLLARALTRRILLAHVAALAFAIHPMNVDSVAWVATRSNLLATLFCLASMLAYLRYTRQPNWTRLLSAVALFALATLSKTAAVALPPVLVLIDIYQRRAYWRNRRPVWRPVLDKLPFFAIAVVIGLVALHFRVDTIDPSGYSMVERLVVGCTALVTYLVKAVVPTHLAMAYALPAKTDGHLAWYLYLAPVALVVASGALLLIRPARRLVFFGLSFFLVTILPSQLVWLVDSYTANRYAYLPYLGLFLIAGFGVEALLKRARTWRVPPHASQLTIGVLVAVAVTFSVLAGLRGAQWRDTKTIMTASIEVEPRVAFVYNSRGIAELEAGDTARAWADFEQALRLDPNLALAYYYRGKIKHLQGDSWAAIGEFDQALARDPGLAVGYGERGKSKVAVRDLAGARADFTQAVTLDPDYAEARYQRAVLEIDAGDYMAARVDLDRVIQAYPAYGDARYQRGVAEDRLGDRPAACADWRLAQSLGQPQAAQAVTDNCG